MLHDKENLKIPLDALRQKPLRLAFLVSGSGTTLQNVLDAISRGELNADVRLVVGSRPGIAGLCRARGNGVINALVERMQFSTLGDYSREVFSLCDANQIDLICLGGWLNLLHIPPAYAGRLMNIHPSLLPSFGGRGMYGKRVHQAVLDHGVKVSGCTVHFVDASYDTGPIILQRTCPVEDDDTAESLAHRVFEQEKLAYPEAIRLFGTNRLRIEGRKVRVLEAGE